MALLPADFPDGEVFGVLASFDSTHDIVHAAEKVREAGFTRWDTHTPFAVHGLDKAMGLGRSRLPYVTLGFGLLGATVGITLQLWSNGLAYPLAISGKPLFNWQPYVPVTFELGILFAALSTVFGMFAFNKLPMHHHPLFSSTEFERFSDDRFFLSIESWDPKFDLEATQQLLSELGASHVEVVKRK